MNTQKTVYLDATQETGRAFLSQNIQGEVIMLNLLKFRELADYSHAPELVPSESISGRDAYRLYMKHTTPFLKEAGGEVLFFGQGSSFLIGPEGEGWDVVMLVKHVSVDVFMSFASNEGYLAIKGHREAALEDSRLLPLTTNLL